MVAETVSSVEDKLDEGEYKEALEAAQDLLAGAKRSEDPAEIADALRLVAKATRVEAGGDAKPGDAEALVEEELAKFKDDGDLRGEATMLLARAEVLSSGQVKQRLGLAEECADDAVTLFEQLGEKELQVAALNRLAAIAALEGEADEAKARAHTALGLAQDAGARKQEGLALHCLAAASALHGNYATAQGHAEAALDVFKDLDAKALQALVYGEMSRWEVKRGNGAEAVKLAQTAQETKPGHRQLQLVVDAYIARGSGKDAAKAAKDAAEAAQNAEDKREEMQALRIQAKALLSAGGVSAEGALQPAQDALALARELSDGRLELALLFVVASAYMAKKQFSKAVPPLEEAVSLADDLELPEEKASALRTVAEANSDAQEYDKAIEAAVEAQALYQTIGDKKGEASTLVVAAVAYYSVDQYDKALAAAQLARELFCVWGDLRREASTLELVATLMLNRGPDYHDQAMETAELIGPIYRELGDVDGQGSAMLFIAMVYLQFGQLDHAHGYAEEAKRIASQAGSAEGEAAALLAIAHTWAHRFEYEGGKNDNSENLAQLTQTTSQALNLARKTKSSQLKATATHWNSVAQLWNRSFDESMTLAKESQTLFQNANETAGEVHALVLISIIYVAMQKKEQGIGAAQNALSLARMGGSPMLEKLAEESCDWIENFEFPRPGGGAGGGGGGGGRQRRAEGSVAQASAVAKNIDKGLVKSKLMEIVRDVMAADDDPEADTPLMDAGMDSLSSTDFASQVVKEFSLGSSPSLVFDYPTVRQLVAHIAEEGSM